MIIPANDTVSGWSRLVPRFTPRDTQHDHEKAGTFDTIIIGAGVVGLSTAHHLHQQDKNRTIAVLDALRVGEGASGRNSGFIIRLPHEGDLEKENSEYLKTINDANNRATRTLENLVKTYNIDCHWHEAGKYQVAVGQRGVKSLAHYCTLLERIGEKYELLQTDDLYPILGTRYYQQAVYTQDSILVQPAALMVGLAQGLADKVSIYENTAVQNIKKTDKGFELHTSGARFSCKQVVLCNNTYIREFGYLRRKIVPIMTFASLTEPLTEQQQQAYQGQYGWGATPADPFGTTMRMTTNKRLLIRNMVRYVPRYNVHRKTYNRIRKAHYAGLNQRFPELKNLTIEHSWAGIFGQARNNGTFVGQLEPGIYAATCHNGVGLAPGTTSGKLLANLITGIHPEEISRITTARGTPNTNPPGILTHIGARSVIQFGQWMGRHEL